MSTCAFCGERHLSGRVLLAHRATPLGRRTVHVCGACVDEARDAGYAIAAPDDAGSRSLPAAKRGGKAYQ
ncbi:MAG TPA: hypothetical protein VEJ20_06835 [Candidatus Eremiobacteraceae bacterium]|nr:hypothetical protein [Candidatus Eremiobacteraceae bacterium]